MFLRRAFACLISFVRRSVAKGRPEKASAPLQEARIEDIGTVRFNRVLDTLQAEGWRAIYVYDGFDAWIDYGRVDLVEDGETLIFEWDNWCEGKIGGPERLLISLSGRFGLTAPKTAERS